MTASKASSNKGPAQQPAANAVAEAQKGGAVAEMDYGEFAGQGFEGQGREDYAIPFLGVLQGLSPQLEKIDGARPGLIFNTVTNALYPKEGVDFVPVTTQHVMVEWKKRDAGGGFVAVHQMDSAIVSKVRAEQKLGKYEYNGNDMIETFYVYGIVRKADGTTEQAIMAFTSTKIKVYKRWMTTARTIQINVPGRGRITPPLFAHSYRLNTVKEKNAKGEFFNWNFNFSNTDAAGSRISVKDTLFQDAVAFRDLIASGAAKAAHETQSAGREPGEDDDKGGDGPY